MRAIGRLKPDIIARISLSGDAELRFGLLIEQIQPLSKILGGINLRVVEVTIDNADAQIVTDQFTDLANLRNEAISFVDSKPFIAVTTEGLTYALRNGKPVMSRGF